jgi:hypothetical protein
MGNGILLSLIPLELIRNMDVAVGWWEFFVGNDEFPVVDRNISIHDFDVVPKIDGFYGLEQEYRSRKEQYCACQGKVFCCRGQFRVVRRTELYSAKEIFRLAMKTFRSGKAMLRSKTRVWRLEMGTLTRIEWKIDIFCKKRQEF